MNIYCIGKVFKLYVWKYLQVQHHSVNCITDKEKNDLNRNIFKVVVIIEAQNKGRLTKTFGSWILPSCSLLNEWGSTCPIGQFNNNQRNIPKTWCILYCLNIFLMSQQHIPTI